MICVPLMSDNKSFTSNTKVETLTGLRNSVKFCTGEPQVMLISFNFLEPPTIFGKNKFHANVGETANLVCETRGYPEPDITWSWKDESGNTFTLNKDKAIKGYSVTTSRSSVGSRSLLKIEKVTTESWTTYSCLAVNVLGEDSHDVTLSGKSKY